MKSRRESPIDVSSKERQERRRAAPKTEWTIRLNKEQTEEMERLSPLAEKLSASLYTTEDKPDTKCPAKKRSLWRAVVEGPEVLKEELIARNAEDPSQFSEPNLLCDLRGSLALAVILKSPEMVRQLLTHGAEPESDNQWYPPTIYAVDTNQRDTLNVFLEMCPKNVRKDSCRLGTVLHAVCRTGNIEILETILALDDLDINEPSPVRGLTPLQTAVCYGHLDVVKRLIKAGANVNARHVGEEHLTGQTALHYAAYRGDVKLTKCLLEHGASRGIQDSKEVLPLVVAANCSHRECFDVLAEGVDLSEPWIDGETLLYYSSSKGYNKLLEYLLESGADPSVLGACGRTPLIEAVLCSKYYCVEIMSRYEQCRQTVNFVETIREGEEMTALRAALMKCKDKILKLLIEMGADVNMCIHFNCDLEPLILHYADDLKIVEFLLKNGANPNFISDNGDMFINRLVGSTTDTFYTAHQILDLAMGFNLNVDLATCTNSEGQSAIGLLMDNVLNYRFAFSCVRTLLEAGCQVTKEMRDWMVAIADDMVDVDDEEESAMEYILNTNGPRSLQELARMSTLRLLPTHGTDSIINDMCIPEPLKDFLKVRTFMKLKAYDIDQFLPKS